MSQEIKAKIDYLQMAIADLEHQKKLGQSLQVQEQIDQQIAKKTAEIAELEAQIAAADREQVKVAALDNYIAILSDMYEALWPSETYRQLLGINAYEEKRANFYQLNQALMGQALDGQHAANEKLLAEKDEKIKLLQKQGIELQQTIDQMKNNVNELESQLAEREKQEQIIEQMKQDNAQQRVQIAELQGKLAQQKEEVKPSPKVTDIINTIKSKNDMGANDLIARWNARQKTEEAKIEVPDVPSLNYPFRGENATNPEADAGNGQVLAAGDAALTFQQANIPNAEGDQGLAGDTDHAEVLDETPATVGFVRQEIAKGLAKLRKEIMGTESVA